MGLFDNLKQGMQEVQKNEKMIAKAKTYADLNKDGKLDGQDLDKAKQYGPSLKSITNKLSKK